MDGLFNCKFMIGLASRLVNPELPRFPEVFFPVLGPTMDHKSAPCETLDTCVCEAECLPCSPETTTMLLTSYTRVQNLKKKLKREQTCPLSKDLNMQPKH